MKRILAALVIALLFHALLLFSKPSWLKKNVTFNKKPPSITVTMSYKKVVIPPPVRKPPVENKKIKKKEVVKPKQIEKKPAPVKVEENVTEPGPVKKQDKSEEKTENKEKSVGPEQVEDTKVHKDGVDGSILIVMKEAVPLYRINPAPRYPVMARKRGYQGTVLLSVLVNKEGKVDILWLFKTSGYKILDNAAIEAVKDWTFEPGRKGDEAVAMWVEVPVKFELE